MFLLLNTVIVFNIPFYDTPDKNGAASKNFYFIFDPENFTKARTSKIRHMHELDNRVMFKAIKKR